MTAPWAIVIPIAVILWLFTSVSLVKYVRIPIGARAENLWGVLFVTSFMAGFFTVVLVGVATS